MDGLPLPLSLRGGSSVPLVGREAAWAALTEGWARVRGGERRFAVVTGEAGAGKSRLAGDFARQVHAGGAVVLYGACSEDLWLPYGPVREAVDEVVRSAGVGALGDDVEAGLASLLGRRPGASGHEADDLDERRLVTTAVTDLLDRITEHAPVLLVLDDMHWCDPATAAVVDQVARGGRPASCLVLVTHRTAPGDITPSARRLLADLRRRPETARIALGPLDEVGVREFIAASAGHALHVGLERVVGLLAEESGGNPFFLGELWRHLVETGRLVQPHGRWRLEGPLPVLLSPPGVRDVIALRIDRLDPEARRAVETAAVIGATFDLQVLAGALGSSPAAVLAALEPACELALVDESPPGTGRFSHALVRRAAYDGQPADLRHQRHLAVARALESSGRPGVEVAVATHLVAAIPLVDRSTAVASVARAATAAMAAGRYADASAALAAALDVVEPGPGRAQLLLDHAAASTRAGDVAGALASALEAHQLGIQANDAALVVRSAITFDDATWRAALPGAEAQRVVETALREATDEGDRLRLRAARARALALRGRDDEARGEAMAVLDLARATADVDAQSLAYAALLFTAWEPGRIEPLSRAAREFVDLAVSVGNREWELWALDKQVLGSIIRGDLDQARDLMVRHHTLAEALGQPLFRVLDRQLRGLVAVGEGRFADAEVLAVEALAEGEQLSGRDASGGFGVQMFSLRREQGRLDEARADLEALADDAASTWRPALAVLCAEVGLVDRATSLLDDLVAEDLASIPRDSLWPATLVYLSEAATATVHRAAAERLLPELEPYRGLVIQAGTFLAAYGAADRYLGMLGSLTGAPGVEEHFEAALRLESRARMPVWSARTQAEYGLHLLRSGSDASTTRGASLLRFAADTAQRLGMEALARSTDAVLVGTTLPERSRRPATADLTDRELAVLRLLVQGRSNRQIGQELSISHHTAANHVRAILLKAGCANRTEAAAWALRLGLTPDR